MISGPILTASEMVAAEEAAMADGVSVEKLMERAGRAVADIAWRMAGKSDTLILCGPGNNGGDGYVVARLLVERGCDVRVAALADPKTEVAKAAREKWDGPVEPIMGARGAPLVVDALFGTGLARPLDAPLASALCDHVSKAKHSLAVDLPSGVQSDSGELLSTIPGFDATVALGALKPAHLLHPAKGFLGQVMLGDIGIAAVSDCVALARPQLFPPTAYDFKYTRGYVLVAAGVMGGAAGLCANAALRAGAGYVALAGAEQSGGPMALVHREASDPQMLSELLADHRLDVAVIGPGLGMDGDAQERLDVALASDHKLVLDADALNLLAGRVGSDFSDAFNPILTPHHGEFVRMFGNSDGSKVERARAAASRAGAVIIYKGGDTVIAAPDGRAAIASAGPAWLSTAGTGDVLTGIVAAQYASIDDPFEAACNAVWLHGEAARRAAAFMIADDLLDKLPGVLASCV